MRAIKAERQWSSHQIGKVTEHDNDDILHDVQR